MSVVAGFVESSGVVRLLDRAMSGSFVEAPALRELQVREGRLTAG